MTTAWCGSHPIGKQIQIPIAVVDETGPLMGRTVAVEVRREDNTVLASGTATEIGGGEYFYNAIPDSAGMHKVSASVVADSVYGWGSFFVHQEGTITA
jgi:hypothetical protein